MVDKRLNHVRIFDFDGYWNFLQEEQKYEVLMDPVIKPKTW